MKSRESKKGGKSGSRQREADSCLNFPGEVSVSLDAVESAVLAELHYVSDNLPGIMRRRAGKGFVYLDSEGRRIADREAIKRIKSLVIPNAWSDVWISPLVEGHLQATGRDARGRKQYLYHPMWRCVRDRAKFNRMVPFGEALPLIRARTERDLALRGLPREKVLATVVKLLQETLIRVGNMEYVRENESFGLTTMQDDHLEVSGATVRFEFRGKSGKEHSVEMTDRRIAAIVKRCRDIPGQELFQYLDDGGQRRVVNSADVNAYLLEMTGERFTAKEFRTWGGTVRAAVTLAGLGCFDSDAEARKMIVEAVKEVATHLGNKPSTCRKYYVHPAVLDAYMEGALIPAMQAALGNGEESIVEGLRAEEAAVLEILREYDERHR